MKIGKCLKIAMAQHEMNTKDVSEELNSSITQVNYWKKCTDCHTATVDKLAAVFNMSAVQFISLADENVNLGHVMTGRLAGSGQKIHMGYEGTNET